MSPKGSEGKPRFSLLPSGFLRGMATVVTQGSVKYDDEPNQETWRTCRDRFQYYDAAMRHLDSWRSGEDIDRESGEHHLFHAAASVAILWAIAQEEDYGS